MRSTDVLIVGGGIVGLATAYNFLQQYPDKTVTILEKEDTLALHQTGHNSGVLHSGVYYKPGTLKAQLCRSGKQAMEAFCAREGIPYEICGKVIVALDEEEQARLQAIYSRGQANGVQCELIDRTRLRELEPHAEGVQALHIPETGIVDYKQVCQRLAALIREQGSQIITGAKVTSIEERNGEVAVQSTKGDFSAHYLINCAGLHSDRVTTLSAEHSPAKIVPFRGEYYKFTAEAEHLCKNLIYPVPDPKFPFLGVHFTRMIEGGVECGPNAVFAFAREGYRKTDVNLRDLAETLTYPGFLRLAARHWRMGMDEMWRSISKAAFVSALQRLIPDIRAEHLIPAPAGVRAQAVARDGMPLDDFAFEESRRIVNVVNAPSPGATASLSIGNAIVGKLAQHF
ncbi:MAG TPA: L-2-hydroxyglutarate oxidase [Ardenticatenaceae bacterium]|jgi:L-2-hydroxyglutarate oxidase